MECIHVEGRLDIIENKRRQSSAVKRIVAKCVESSEEVNINDFGLKELPDEIFLLIRQNKVQHFDASQNFLSVLPIQITSCLKLSFLNISSNRLSTLPREMVHCKQLKMVDISSNNFVEIPSVLLEIETVTDINAKNNFIAEVNDEDIENHKNLEEVNLKNNPLTTSCHERLRRINKVSIVISEKKLEEWEDLSI